MAKELKIIIGFISEGFSGVGQFLSGTWNGAFYTAFIDFLQILMFHLCITQPMQHVEIDFPRSIFVRFWGGVNADFKDLLWRSPRSRCKRTDRPHAPRQRTRLSTIPEHHDIVPPFTTRKVAQVATCEGVYVILGVGLEEVRSLATDDVNFGSRTDERGLKFRNPSFNHRNGKFVT